MEEKENLILHINHPVLQGPKIIAYLLLCKDILCFVNVKIYLFGYRALLLLMFFALVAWGFLSAREITNLSMHTLIPDFVL